MIVVEHWGAPAGFAVVVPREDGNANLDGPFVEPDLWRGGFGRKLVEEAAHFATILEASLLIVAASTKSTQFYAKCGFKPSGTASTPEGPVALMQRSLVF